MIYTLEVTSAGDSIGVIFPEEIVRRLGLKPGDILSATSTPVGVNLTPCTTEFAAQLEVAKQVMREDRDLLRKLADS